MLQTSWIIKQRMCTILTIMPLLIVILYIAELNPDARTMLHDQVDEHDTSEGLSTKGYIIL